MDLHRSDTGHMYALRPYIDPQLASKCILNSGAAAAAAAGGGRCCDMAQRLQQPRWCSSSIVKMGFIVCVLSWCCFDWCCACWAQEREALLQLKHSQLDEPSPYMYDDWVGEDCCKWEGVECSNRTSRVVGVFLERGSWATEQNLTNPLLQLSKLVEIQINDVYIHSGDVMPAFCKMEQLEKLTLDSNDFLPGGTLFDPCLCNMTLTHLYLSGNRGLRGNIPPCLGRIHSLKQLHVWSNDLEGDISPTTFSGMNLIEEISIVGENLLRGVIQLSWFATYRKLTHLELFDIDDKAQVETEAGLEYQAPLFRLKYLRLSRCGLNKQNGGTIPSFLSSQSDLEYLDLSENSLVGGFPSFLGKMNSLTHLYLSANQLSGRIPFLIFANDLTSIQEIDLSYNHFEDSFSFSALSNNSKIIFVDFSDNHRLKVETASLTWTPAFRLSFLYLRNCNLDVFPRFLSSQYSLQSLDLSQNLLMGTIPSWLFYNSSISILQLGNNELHGPFPRRSRKQHRNSSSSIRSLDISNNFFDDASDIDILLPHLNALNMSSNAFQGAFPESLCGYNDMRYLDLSFNGFSGELPKCFTRNQTNLNILILSNNNLQGEISILAADAYLPTLTVLKLDGNDFSGKLPPTTVWNNSFLMVFDVRNNNLFGKIPDELFDSRHRSEGDPLGATAILLGGNNFHGDIPRSLCRNQNLRYLDLSQNFFSGPIPPCISNITPWASEQYEPWIILERYGIEFFTKGSLYMFVGKPSIFMTGMDLSSNKLSGSIPMQLGELKALHSLNLSNNLLSGSLPPSLVNMSAMESLDLSNNRLSGKLSYQLTNLDSLAVLNVSYNNFSGTIPFTGKFTTFSTSSFLSNPQLCGPPLERNCSAVKTPPQEEFKEESESSFLESDLFFYLYVAASFALGFWSTLYVVIFKRKHTLCCHIQKKLVAQVLE